MISILFPTDFSENSMNAIRYALEFFKYEKVSFYFMNAYQKEFYDHEDLVTREDYDEVLKKVKEQSEKNLDSLIATVEQLSPNPRHTYHAKSAYNSLVEEAKTVVEAQNIDLIVMGTKGKSDDRKLIFGSQTFQVLKYVQCPVLAIPAQYTNTQPKRILFPTDYLIPYKRRELKLLCDLSASYRSTIDVVHVSRVDKLSLRQEDNRAFIKDTVCHTEVNFYTVQGTDVAKTIQDYIEKHAVDMLVMVNTQHSFLENMLFPSTIDKVSLDLKIPLLAMQNSTRTATTQEDSGL